MATAAQPRNNPVSGATYFMRGLSLITVKGVKRYVAIPLTVNVVLFGFAIYYGWSQLGVLTTWLEGHLPDWLDWLSWLLIPLFILAVMLVLFFGFSAVGNLIAAPFNGLLAEAVERKLTGQTLDSGGGWRKLAKDFAASIVSEFRKLLYFVIRAIPLLILFVIPGVNLLAPFLWFLFLLERELLEPKFDLHGLSFPEQRRILASRRFLSLGFGSVMTLVLLIPGLNLLVIPAGVAGATAMWVEQLSASAGPSAG